MQLWFICCFDFFFPNGILLISHLCKLYFGLYQYQDYYKNPAETALKFLSFVFLAWFKLCQILPCWQIDHSPNSVFSLLWGWLFLRYWKIDIQLTFIDHRNWMQFQQNYSHHSIFQRKNSLAFLPVSWKSRQLMQKYTFNIK